MSFLVRFEPSGKSVRVPAGTALMEAAVQAGLPVGSACRGKGVCCRCGLRILEGHDGVAPESPQEQELKSRNRIEADLRLSCLVAVECDLRVTAPYW